jgi:hypothetical protein
MSDRFNEGLEQGIGLGELRERERIVKMLEDPATMSNWWATPDKSLGLYGNLKNYVIALIKGKTNE